jgi:hypothetical protein
MGLKTTLEDAVDSIITGLDDLVESVTYHRVTMGAYNPVTDSHGITTVTSTFDAVFYREQEEDLTWRKVLYTHAKLLVPGSAVTFEPKQNDYVIINTRRWEVFD